MIVHVRYEAMDHNSANGTRYMFNLMSVRDFDPRGAPLCWIYAYYYTRSIPPIRMRAWLSVKSWRRHRTPEPLPYHVLFGDGRADLEITGSEREFVASPHAILCR